MPRYTIFTHGQPTTVFAASLEQAVACCADPDPEAWVGDAEDPHYDFLSACDALLEELLPLPEFLPHPLREALALEALLGFVASGDLDEYDEYRRLSD